MPGTAHSGLSPFFMRGVSIDETLYESKHLRKTEKTQEEFYGKIKSRKPLNEQEIQAVIQQLWLTYFNATLFAQGLITEEQRNRMRIRIKNRAAAARQ